MQKPLTSSIVADPNMAYPAEAIKAYTAVTITYVVLTILLYCLGSSMSWWTEGKTACPAKPAMIKPKLNGTVLHVVGQIDVSYEKAMYSIYHHSHLFNDDGLLCLQPAQVNSLVHALL
jgi:hypothetical protein